MYVVRFHRKGSGRPVRKFRNGRNFWKAWVTAARRVMYYAGFRCQFVFWMLSRPLVFVSEMLNVASYQNRSGGFWETRHVLGINDVWWKRDIRLFYNEITRHWLTRLFVLYRISLVQNIVIGYNWKLYRVRQITFSFLKCYKKTTEYFLKFLFLFESTILPVNNGK